MFPSWIVQFLDAGVESVFPAGSVARTWNLWSPSPSGGNAFGDEQALNGPFPSRHSNVEPGSFDVNSNVASATSDGSCGPLVMVVCGGWRSTFQENAAASEWLSAASAARTRNSCVPASTGTERGESHGANSAPSTEHWNDSAVPAASEAFSPANIDRTNVTRPCGCPAPPPARNSK